jgi:ABC-2 type transport system ATP-binding protein
MNKYNSIIFDGVSKSYKISYFSPWKEGKIINALNSASLSCPSSKITCLLGPNGAGKTTIIKIIAGLITHDAGRVILLNNQQNSKIHFPASAVGIMTSNDRSFYWRLTGRQNLEFFSSLHGNSRRKTGAILNRILEVLDIESEADKPFRLYSSGIKQKFMLARALIPDPKILLLDEPTSHIDPVAKEGIHYFLLNKVKSEMKTTVLVCTHDIHEASLLADKIVLINHGKVIAQGSPSDLGKFEINEIRFYIHFLIPPKKGWTIPKNAELLEQNKNLFYFSSKSKKIISATIESAVHSGGKILFCHEKEQTILDVIKKFSNEKTA